jgi:hypothetical protein
MSRKVNIKALLPHRDTVSIMTISPYIAARTVHLRGEIIAAASLNTPQKSPLFAVLCPTRAHRNRA